MKYFPPERTQEQLDRAGAYRLPTHWDVLECLRSLADRMHGVSMNTNDSRRRSQMKDFAVVLETIHDHLGGEEGITLDYFEKGRFRLREKSDVAPD